MKSYSRSNPRIKKNYSKGKLRNQNEVGNGPSGVFGSNKYTFKVYVYLLLARLKQNQTRYNQLISVK